MGMEEPRARFIPANLVEAIHQAVSIHVDADCSPATAIAIETSLFDTMHAAAEAGHWQFSNGSLYNVGIPERYRLPIRIWECHVTQIEDCGPHYVLTGFVVVEFTDGQAHQFDEYTGVNLSKAAFQPARLH